MSTAFLCGFIDEDYFNHYDITRFIEIVKSIIEENKIDKIYHCRRTYFDIKFCEIISFLRFDDIEIIELRDIYKNDFEYRYKQLKNAFRVYCPFKEEIDNSVLYKTLYDWAIENSDILITYSKFDDDISKQIIERAKEKEKQVFNIADMAREFLHLYNFC
ncbi:MAG: hypothetical protein IJR70_07915 [Eubacterium sp.]|nr:hypothetical protein [Eubacterium sp.]